MGPVTVSAPFATGQREGGGINDDCTYSPSSEPYGVCSRALCVSADGFRSCSERGVMRADAAALSHDGPYPSLRYVSDSRGRARSSLRDLSGSMEAEGVQAVALGLEWRDIAAFLQSTSYALLRLSALPW